MRDDRLNQSKLDRMLAFASPQAPAEHNDLVEHYALWYGLNVSVYYAVVYGHDDVHMPARMREFNHYLEALGYS